MSIFSPKQKKNQGWDNPMSVLLSVTLIGVFMVSGPLNATLHNAINDVLETFGSTESESIYKSPEAASFPSDEQYWDFYCSNGWNSDSTCDDIVSRVQSCLVNMASLYCSAYKSYMQEFLKQRQVSIAREISRP